MSKATVQIIRDSEGAPSYVLIIQNGRTLKVNYDSNKGFTFEGNRDLIPSVPDMLKLIYPVDKDVINVFSKDNTVYQWDDGTEAFSRGNATDAGTSIIVPQNEFWYVYGFWVYVDNIDVADISVRIPPEGVIFRLWNEGVTAGNMALFLFPQVLPLPSGSQFLTTTINDAGLDSVYLHVLHRRVKL